jgi:succinoglycan biosynthesis protein ExoL
MKICIVLPNLTDARAHARVRGLATEGANVSLFGFRRPTGYSGDVPPAQITCLGVIEDGKYPNRIRTYLEAACSIRSQLNDADIVYTFGLDVALFCHMVSRSVGSPPKLVMEIQDIRDILLSTSAAGTAARALDRYILGQLGMLVVTSDLYVSEYYERTLNRAPKNVFVIENKVGASLLAQSKASRRSGETLPRADNETIVIGYFGLLRCAHTLRMILDIANRAKGSFRFVLRGGVLGSARDLMGDILSHPHIHYGGPYKSPTDVSSMYAHIDLAWTSYPGAGEGKGNWQWARTNRFYEAMYFHKPAIALSGSADGQLVAQWGVGICIRPADHDASVTRVLRIRRPDIESWVNNIKRLPVELYTDLGEHRCLLAALDLIA